MTTKDMTQRPRHPYPYLEPVAALPMASNIPTPGTTSTSADFPLEEEWMELYLDLFSGAGRATYLKRAERLSGYGWGPADLRRVCSNPRELAKLTDFAETPVDEVEALVALVHEASMYFGTGHTLALDRRTWYVAQLSEEGWSQTQLALLIGVSKQRVQAMLKGWKKNRPKKYAIRG